MPLGAASLQLEHDTGGAAHAMSVIAQKLCAMLCVARLVESLPEQPWWRAVPGGQLEQAVEGDEGALSARGWRWGLDGC